MADFFSQNKGGQNQRRAQSPVLDVILNGGSSVSFNILNRTKAIGDEPRFFDRRTLNETIIFKYPDFEMEVSEMDGFDFSAGSKLAEIDKPIETAIFVPVDTTRLTSGGNAIYLRQAGFEQLMENYFGIDLGADEDIDLEKLTVIDECPTLDPFLLQAMYQERGIYVNESYFEISKSEERHVRRKIEEKITPVVEFAHKQVGLKNAKQKTQRFVDAIWNPNTEDAGLFVTAFGIKEEDIMRVMNGWKGVSYYQYLFMKNAASLKMVLEWFRSPYSRPSDASRYKMYMDGLDMHKRQVFAQLEGLIKNARGTLVDYDTAYQDFLQNQNPKPLRDFYKTAENRYWVLGFTCAALFHCVNLVKRTTRGHPHNRVTFDDMSDLYSRMSATMSSRRSESLPNSLTI